MPVEAGNYQPPSTNAYYVSEWGEAANSGSRPDSPWPVAKAFADAPEGATIIFRKGSYRDVAGVKLAKRFTLRPYLNEEVWIKGSMQLRGLDWKETANGHGRIWRYDNWIYEFAPEERYKSDVDPRTNPTADYRDRVFINQNALEQVFSLAEVAANKFYVDYDQDKLYIGSSPIGNNVEATRLRSAFAQLKAGTLIQGLGFTHFADEAIFLASTDITLRNNTFSWNGRFGVRVQGSQRLQVLDSDFYYNGMNGIRGNGASYARIENNTVRYNNISSYKKFYSAAGIKLSAMKDAKLLYSTITDNYATGLWFDVSVFNAQVIGNTVSRNGGTGIFLELTHGTTVARNIMHNNEGFALFLADATATTVVNNTIINDTGIGQGINEKDSPRRADQVPETDSFYDYIHPLIAQGATWISKDNVILNNVVSTKNTSHFQAWEGCLELNAEGTACIRYPLSADKIKTADYNAYYQSAATRSMTFKWRKSATEVVSYHTLAEFKAGVGGGYEVNSLSAYGTSNPFLFVNPASGDFRLQSGSVLRGKGKPLSAEVAAAIGLPAGVAVDIGAIQYAGSSAGRVAHEEGLSSEANSFMWHVYPVPVSRSLTIDFGSDDKQEVRVLLADGMGKVIQQTAVKATEGMNRLTIPVASLPEGIYFLNLSSPQGNANKKIIVTH